MPFPSRWAIIEVRDGNRVRLLRFNQIDWVNAAGNYVELNGAFGSQLARRTMADIAAELAPHGFVRVHRSRLVRKDAIASIATHQSGDCDITLRSGVVISGSRRYRQNLSWSGQICGGLPRKGARGRAAAPVCGWVREPNWHSGGDNPWWRTAPSP